MTTEAKAFIELTPVVTTHAEHKPRLKAERHREQALVKAFANAVSTADLDAFGSAMEALQYSFVWPRAVRAVEHLDPPAKFRQPRLEFWQRHGDGIRSAVNNDLLLIKLLHVLLPKYKGPAATLYRGEIFGNRRDRTYGLSWTTELEVARHFANGIQRTCQGGSVVLKTRASAAAIICAPKLVTKRFAAEHEILVDRRKLGRVDVLGKFAQKAV